MNPEQLTSLTNEELLQQAKKIKSGKIMDAILIGTLIGITIFSLVKYGFGFFNFFPAVLAFAAVRNSKKKKQHEQEVQQELKARNLSPR